MKKVKYDCDWGHFQLEVIFQDKIIPIISLKKTLQAVKHERHRIRTPAANATAARSKAWRPSLQSISEAAS